MRVRQAADVRAEDEPYVGGKAAGLARLGARGARVPPWFVVSVEAFRAHMEKTGLASQIAAELSSLRAAAEASPSSSTRIEEVAAALRAAVEATALDGELAAEVARALAQIAPGPFAVRSSMPGEDSAERSFAGQFDTYLFQRDAREVAESIVRCWGSAFTARSIAYRLRVGGPLEGAAMAVVVQRMIGGRVSGVAFTANPVSGRRDETLITACWGLGEGIVGGACNTDEFVVGADGRERSAKVVEKDVQVIPHPSGRGTEEASVEAALQKARCLTAAEVTRIGREAQAVASALGAPQDIEWTLEGGDLFLLQARPITALGPVANRGGARVVWDNSNIQESYCGVTTPLTFSFALAAYATVYEQTMRVLGIPETVIASHRPMLRNMLGLVRGRVYYNINNWYRGLLLLPSFGTNKADMERMMGLEHAVDFVSDEALSLGEKLRRAPRMLLTLGRLLREFARLEARVTEFMAHFERTVASIDRASFRGKSLDELLALTDRLRVELMEKWEAPILNDFFVMMASGRLRRALAAIAPGQEAALWNVLVSGEEGIESTEPTRALLRMAKRVRERPELAAITREGGADEALVRLRKADPELSSAFDRYLDRYGDRAMGELKLETISLREDPSFLVRVLRNYLDRADLDPDALLQRERQAQVKAMSELDSRAGFLARRRLQKALRNARRGVKARENMRLARTRVFGLYRDIYRAIGEELFAVGRLDEPRDVFYLAVEEIAAYHGGTAVSADLAAIARARKAEYAKYEAEELPNHFETLGPVHHGNAFRPPTTTRVATVDGNARVLRGLGCSPGIVEAEIRVIKSPQDDLSVNGRILTALRTDPGWAPLFPTATGILVERGSTLSHSAVLARELGIPAVVGVPDLLRLVRVGEPVRLDGSAGTVERLSKAPSDA